jgi:uncharacterized Zn-binding protein involved in type VI secretion
MIMGNPVASLLSMHKCGMPDAGGTHVEIPFFFSCSTIVKVLKLNAGVQGDMTLCFHRIPTFAGPVPIPMPNTVQKGSLTVKFGEKPSARQKDMLSHGEKISRGIPLIKIG